MYYKIEYNNKCITKSLHYAIKIMNFIRTLFNICIYYSIFSTVIVTIIFYVNLCFREIFVYNSNLYF